MKQDMLQNSASACLVRQLSALCFHRNLYRILANVLMIMVITFVLIGFCGGLPVIKMV